MRTINVFKIVDGKITYVDAVKAAVLDPRITGLKLHLNGGWDWIDQKYGFIQLLLRRGQIAEISSNSDLLGCDEYLQDAKLGCMYGRRLSIELKYKPQTKKTAYASEKRINAARERINQFCQRSAS